MPTLLALTTLLALMTQVGMSVRIKGLILADVADGGYDEYFDYNAGLLW